MAPTEVLIISGGCHTPVHFTPISDILLSRGYTVSNLRLPSNSILPPPNSFQADIELVRGVAEQKAEGGQEIIVLMHSYGGFLGTEALVGLGVKERRKQGLPGGIKWLAYMAALVPFKGEKLDDTRRIRDDVPVLLRDTDHSVVVRLIGLPRDPWLGTRW